MSEKELLELWVKFRNQLIFAQFAPTFLLITTVGLVPQIKAAGNLTIQATVGILLASGILGALAEFQASHEAQTVAKLENPSALSKTIAKSAIWLHVAKFLTPTIFVGIFVFLVLALIGY